MLQGEPPSDIISIPARSILRAQGAFQMFYDVYTGNLDELKTLPFDQQDFIDIFISLLFTALFTHHYDIFNYIMNQLRRRSEPEYRFNQFTDAYFEHLDLITPEDLLIVGPYISPDKLSAHITQLNEKGFSELARLLQ